MSPGVYLDTNAFVYAVQGADEAAGSVQHLLREMERRGIKPVTSEMILAEVHCQRDLTPDLHASYQDLLIESQTIRLDPVTRDILLASAAMRREGASLKLQDALHFTTTISAKCRYILTNDHRFRSESNVLTVVRPTSPDIDDLLSALDG